eukprot:jgi/Undpi1/10186/HiC_scaffold_28.g12639.m1
MDKLALGVGDGRYDAGDGVTVLSGATLPLSPPPPSSPTLAMPTIRDENQLALEHRAALNKLAKERNHTLDRWADATTPGLTDEEVALNAYQRQHCFEFSVGEMGFNPPVPARNAVSVSMHNPRFSAALWAVNAEAYRHKGLCDGSFVDKKAYDIEFHVAA